MLSLLASLSLRRSGSKHAHVYKARAHANSLSFILRPLGKLGAGSVRPPRTI